MISNKFICICAGTEEEAAEAYDIAAIKFRGLNAVTNFDMNRYDVKSILESNTLPIGGGAAKRLKEAQAMESSRKRDEMLALSTTFQYGSPSTSAARLQAYPTLLQQQQQQFDQQPQPLLSLQNQHEISHYAHDTSFHQNYIQTQLQLQQQQQSTGSYIQQQQQSHQMYNSYMHSHPALLQGLMEMGSSTAVSVMDNNGGTSSATGGSYVGGGGYLGMALNSTPAAEELALVKVDYDMPSGGYGGWSGGGSVQGSSNPGVFSMWND